MTNTNTNTTERPEVTAVRRALDMATLSQEATRDEIAKAVDGDAPAIDIAIAVNRLATYEGRVAALTCLLAQLKHRHESVSIDTVILNVLNASHPDDEWSGRLNDIRRLRDMGWRDAINGARLSIEIAIERSK